MARQQLFLFAAVIFCSFSRYVCTPTDPEPWAVSENGNNCILLKFEGKLTVQYTKTDNSSSIGKLDIKDATVNNASICDANEPLIVLSWKKNLIGLTYSKNTDEETYAIKKIELFLAKEELPNFSSMSMEHIKLTSQDSLRWTSLGKSYRCEIEQSIELTSPMPPMGTISAIFTYSKYQHQAFFDTKKDKVFDTAETCTMGFAEPWGWFDGTNTCILATMEGYLKVTYNDKDGKALSRILRISHEKKAQSGKCEGNEQSLTLELKDSSAIMMLTYTKEETKNTFKLKKVDITLPENVLKDISPALTEPVQMSYSGDTWTRIVGKAYECDTGSELNFKDDVNKVTGVLTILSEKHEAFRTKSDRIFSDSEKCQAPVALPTGIAPSAPIMTATPSAPTKTTSALGTVTTPWNYTNPDTKDVCIVAKFEAKFNLQVNGTKLPATVTVPSNAIVVDGSCGNVTQWIKLEWKTNDVGSINSLKLSFNKTDDKYYLSGLSGILAVSIFKETGAVIPKKVHLDYTGAEWKTPIEKSCLCNKTTNFLLTSDDANIAGNITLSKFHAEAYRESKDTTFHKNKGECGEESSNTGPIVVGIILGVVVVGAIVYFGRSFWKK